MVERAGSSVSRCQADQRGIVTLLAMIAACALIVPALGVASAEPDISGEWLIHNATGPQGSADATIQITQSESGIEVTGQTRLGAKCSGHGEFAEGKGFCEWVCGSSSGRTQLTLDEAGVLHGHSVSPVSNWKWIGTRVEAAAGEKPAERKPESPSGEASSAPAGAERLDQITGMWRGTVHQVGSGTYQIEIAVSPSPPQTLKVAYPSLGCSGSLVVTETGTGRFVLRETIDHDPQGRCVKAGIVHLKLNSKGRLQFDWFYPDKPIDEVNPAAVALLEKESEVPDVTGGKEAEAPAKSQQRRGASSGRSAPTLFKDPGVNDVMWFMDWRYALLLLAVGSGVIYFVRPRSRRESRNVNRGKSPGTNWQRLTRALIVLVLFVPAAYLLLWGASRVHVSGGVAADIATDDGPIFQVLRKGEWLGIPQPNVVRVQRVDLLDAVVNAIFVFCTVALFSTALIPLLVGTIVVFIGGIVTASWEWIVAALFGAVVTVIFPIGVVIMAISLWIGLLIQPATPAYVFMWIMLGLPMLALGSVSGAVPVYYVSGTNASVDTQNRPVMDT